MRFVLSRKQEEQRIAREAHEVAVKEARTYYRIPGVFDTIAKNSTEYKSFRSYLVELKTDSRAQDKSVFDEALKILGDSDLIGESEGVGL